MFSHFFFFYINGKFYNYNIYIYSYSTSAFSARYSTHKLGKIACKGHNNEYRRTRLIKTINKTQYVHKLLWKIVNTYVFIFFSIFILL